MNPPTPPLGDPMPHCGIHGLMMMMMMMRMMMMTPPLAQGLDPHRHWSQSNYLYKKGMAIPCCRVLNISEQQEKGNQFRRHNAFSWQLSVWNFHGDHKNSRLLVYFLSLNCLLLFLSGRILLPSQKIAVLSPASLREKNTAPSFPIPLPYELKPEEIRMLHKFDSRLFFVYLRSTRGSLKPVLLPTSTRIVLFKVRMHVSIAIHSLGETSGKPAEKISCQQTNGKKKNNNNWEAKSEMIALFAQWETLAF